ncbi:MAG: phospholipid carrier-dependent glycosyltransferase [Pleurocapsa sp.]
MDTLPYVILGIIWLLGAIGDRLWYWYDRSVPTWDPADYLNGALNYWNALQTPQWFSGDWWRSFWLLSNKIPPLNYILTVPFLNIFGTSQDAASVIMLLYSAILLISVYGLGVILFDVTVGLFAAGLCQLIPGLYAHRLEFLLDYPLAAMTTVSFAVLTWWYWAGNRRQKSSNERDNFRLKSWLLGILLGITCGLAMLTKQTALFFLFFPIVYVFASCFKHRQWLRLIQLIVSGIIGLAICFPWYRTNWLLILTSGKRATIDSAIAEGDPPLNTLAAWTYYAQILPDLVSWHLLLIPLVGLILYVLFQGNRAKTLEAATALQFNWKWLSIFFAGGYLLSSLNMNKDARYILPLLPVLSLILALGLLSWNGFGKRYIRWGTIALAIVLMVLNMFPLGGKAITQTLSPRAQHYPYLGQQFPHPQVIQEIIDTSPYLRSTLGVLPSTPEINQHNFSFYGGQKNFQVVGRQVGIKIEEVEPDARSLDWFITKTGNQGSIPEAQPSIVNLVETGGDFKLHRSWQLPDDSLLKLYHRDRPIVTVKTREIPPSLIGDEALRPKLTVLDRVILPPVAPPGAPIPVTYKWSGNWEQLHSAMVLLTWLPENSSSDNSLTDSVWLHDHSIGMGLLDSSRREVSNATIFEVIENTAMLPPANIEPGTYILKAVCLNRETGETQPMLVPHVSLTIDPTSPAIAAPELDLVTQLREIAPMMADTIAGLEPIFTQTARINQYDAQHDYLPQTEFSLSYRLQNYSLSLRQRLNWLYTVALSQVLQQDVDGAIASFQEITKLDPQNPYGYGYLAFVYLYDWKPKSAEIALSSARAIAPELPEIKTLSGVAAIFQGKLIKAWRFFQ